MAIPRIDQMITCPIIGRYYLVPTIRYPYYGLTADWPVIGPRHEDTEFFNFPYQHYHVDGRFISAHQKKFLECNTNRTIEYIVGRAPLMYRSYGSDEVQDHPACAWKKLLCRRSSVVYPFSEQKAVIALREAFSGKKLCKRICPHRGANLASIAPDEHGIITCPLHGLRWVAETGEAAP